MLEDYVRNTGDSMVCAVMASDLERSGDYAGAVAYFQRAADLAVADTQYLVAYGCLLRCAILLETLGNRRELTEEMFLTAIDTCPDRREGYALLARHYLGQGMRRKAQVMADRGLALPEGTVMPVGVPFQGDYDLLWVKIQTMYHLGDSEGAQRLLEATYARPDMWWGRDALIRLTETMGNDPKGLPALTYPTVPGFSTVEPIVYHYRKYFGPIADTVFDIGTRDGRDAQALKESLHASRVLAFDAHPDCARAAKDAFPDILVYHCAVSDSDGETDFQVVRSSDETLVGCSSIHADKILQRPEFEGTMTVERVQSLRMDTFLDNRAFRGTIDVVKVDTEGFTWQVLMGFGRWLERVRLFHLETELEPTHPEHRDNKAVAVFMELHGFVLVDTSYEWGPGIEDQVWVNRRLALPPHDNGLETSPHPRS